MKQNIIVFLKMMMYIQYSVAELKPSGAKLYGLEPEPELKLWSVKGSGSGSDCR